jgi:hypothetical protein
MPSDRQPEGGFVFGAGAAGFLIGFVFSCFGRSGTAGGSILSYFQFLN